MSKETGGGNPAEKEGEMCTGSRKKGREAEFYQGRGRNRTKIQNTV